MVCKKRILVVEDNADSRSLLALVLGRSGYDIAEAANGLDAIAQVRAIHPDLIFMDLGLPGMTGDEATACLKADESTRHIPVVVNTAFHRDSVRVGRAIAAGAAQILHKPTPLKVFQEVAHRFLSADSVLTGASTSHKPLDFKLSSVSPD